MEYSKDELYALDRQMTFEEVMVDFLEANAELSYIESRIEKDKKLIAHKVKTSKELDKIVTIDDNSVQMTFEYITNDGNSMIIDVVEKDQISTKIDHKMVYKYVKERIALLRDELDRCDDKDKEKIESNIVVLEDVLKAKDKFTTVSKKENVTTLKIKKNKVRRYFT